MEASQAQGWIVDGFDDEEDDEEVYPGSGSGEWLKMQREQNRCQNLEKAQKKLSLTFSSREVRELHREDFESKVDMEDEYDGNEEIIFSDSDDDRELQE